jgi:prevent-host-death family protein
MTAVDVPVEHVGLRELTNHTSGVLSKVKEGREVIVTEHGRPIARIVPIQSRAAARLAEAVARGWATPARRTGPRSRPNPTIEPRGGLVSDLIEEQRG